MTAPFPTRKFTHLEFFKSSASKLQGRLRVFTESLPRGGTDLLPLALEVFTQSRLVLTLKRIGLCSQFFNPNRSASVSGISTSIRSNAVENVLP